MCTHPCPLSYIRDLSLADRTMIDDVMQSQQAHHYKSRTRKLEAEPNKRCSKIEKSIPCSEQTTTACKSSIFKEHTWLDDM